MDKENFRKLLLQYRRLGWLIIPLNGKKPVWKNWTHPETFDFDPWIRTWEEIEGNSTLNVGIITGRPSKLIAVDVDDPKIVNFNPQPALEQGALAHTARRGLRLVFRSENPEILKFSKKVVCGGETVLEVLGDGCQFMAPPSVHPDIGQILEWTTPLPEKAGDILTLSSMKKFRSLLAQCVGNREILAEIFANTFERKEMEREDILKEWGEKILRHLKIVKDNGRYIQIHCPFHPPDNRPSFVFYRNTCLGVDFHDGQTYTLKELAEKLGIKLSSPRFNPVPLADLIRNAKPIEYLSYPLIPRRSLIIWAGKPGIRKSMLALHIAHRISKGGKLFDVYEARQGRVLIIDEENNPSIYRQRCELLGINPENIECSSLEGFRLDRDIKALKEYLKTKKSDLVILDSWTPLMGKTTDENKAGNVANILSQLRRLAYECDASIMLIHHLRKNLPYTVETIDELRGSSVLVGEPDAVILVQRFEEEIVLKTLKARYGGEIALRIAIEENDEGRLKFKYLGEIGAESSDVERCANAILDYMKMKGQPVRRDELLTATQGFSRATFDRALKYLLGMGKIEKVRRGVYRLTPQKRLEETA